VLLFALIAGPRTSQDPSAISTCQPYQLLRTIGGAGASGPTGPALGVPAAGGGAALAAAGFDATGVGQMMTIWPFACVAALQPAGTVIT
jgi:hypothetical protein